MKAQFQRVEAEIRSTEEQIRMTEKQVQLTVSEIANQAHSVNKYLTQLKLQKPQGQPEAGYSSGFNISMDDEGILDKGKTDMHRDVQPLLEDMKSKWKTKVNELNHQREAVSQELVQNDIKIRRLDEEVRSLTNELEKY